MENGDGGFNDDSASAMSPQTSPRQADLVGTLDSSGAHFESLVSIYQYWCPVVARLYRGHAVQCPKL